MEAAGVSRSDKPDIPDRFGLRALAAWDVPRWFGPLVAVMVAITCGLALAVVVVVLAHALFGFLPDAPRIGFGTGAVAVALISAPFVIWRSLVAQRTVDVTEQGHITDRINKAVELLGHREPAVRMGAILSFDRIMADSAVDRVMVLKIMNAYITYHQPAVADGGDDEVRDTTIDVQAALDVLSKWQS
jgi:hypothetical protein